MELINILKEHKLLGIIRGSDPSASVRSALTLIEEGVKVLEISLTSVDALHVLRQVTKEVGEDAYVGAGTVMTSRDVDAALEHGARYIVTPAVTTSLPYAVSQGVSVLCGALTPSEIAAAIEKGADAVKVFPASTMGPGYIRDLRGPFPDLPLIPVGGVGAEDLPAYLEAGVSAVGVASPLCGDAPNGGDVNALRERARLFLREVAG